MTLKIWQIVENVKNYHMLKSKNCNFSWCRIEKWPNLLSLSVITHTKQLEMTFKKQRVISDGIDWCQDLRCAIDWWVMEFFSKKYGAWPWKIKNVSSKIALIKPVICYMSKTQCSKSKKIKTVLKIKHVFEITKCNSDVKDFLWRWTAE